MSSKSSTTNQSSPLEAMEISLHQAADIMGISVSLARKIVSEGHVKRSSRGMVRIADWGRGYVAYRDAGDKRSTRSAATSIVGEARAAEINQRIALRDRDLVHVNEATMAIDHVVGACVETFNALPAMMTRDIAERKRLERIVREGKHGVVKKIKEAAELLEKGSKLPDDH